MGLTESLVLYLIVGVAVSVASYLSEPDRRPGRALTVAAAMVFWPLFLPVLLSGERRGRQDDSGSLAPSDQMTRAIAQVERELQAALGSLDGWPEAALSREKERIGELRAALAAQASRIREMDRLLGQTALGETAVIETNEAAKPHSLTGESHDRWQRSQQAREQNLRRLAGIRRQAHADLMATLAWIGELVSMIHLAKFTGAPTARTEQLVAQIAAAVEGVSRASSSELFDEARSDSIFLGPGEQQPNRVHNQTSLASAYD